MSHSEQMRRVLNQLEIIGTQRNGKTSLNDSKISNQTPAIRQLRENIMSTFNTKTVGAALNEARVQELKSQIYISKLVLEYYNRPQSIVEVRGEEARKLRKEKLNKSLSRIIRNEPGGKLLIDYMHKKHKLSDTAVYLQYGIQSTAKKTPAEVINDLNDINDINDSDDDDDDIDDVNNVDSGSQVVTIFNGQRILWELFKSHPDNFQIIIAEKGVVGIKPFAKDIEQRRLEKGDTYNPATDKSLRYQIVAFDNSGQLNPNLLRPPPKINKKTGMTIPQVLDPTDPSVMMTRGGLAGIGKKPNPEKPLDPRNRNIFDKIREELGTINSIAITTGAIEHEKIKQRTTRDQRPKTGYSAARSQAIERVRPVLLNLAKTLIKEMQADEAFDDKVTKIQNFIGELEKVKKHEPLPNNVIKIIDRAAAQASNSSIASDGAAEFLAMLGQKVTTKIDGQLRTHNTIEGRKELGDFLNEIRGVLLSDE